MESLEERIQRAALERFGLVAGQVDYTLDRIVRVAALALSARYASFSVIEGGQRVPLATFGGFGFDDLEQQITRRIVRSGESVYIRDLHAPDWKRYGTPLRSLIAVPVYAATKVVIGTLCVATPRVRNLDAPLVKRLLNDCVRLIEDALMMRGAAVRDPLTGLYNRRFFHDQVGSEWRRAMRLQLPISMMVIDIDHFKAYNDTAGHIAGDQIIIGVGKVIESRVRRAGDTVCRFGGEEYALIAPATGQSDAEALAESIRAGIEESGYPHPAHPAGPGRAVTASIGVTTVNTKEELHAYPASELLAIADQALYEAKRAGRNCVRTRLPAPVDESDN